MEVLVFVVVVGWLLFMATRPTPVAKAEKPRPSEDADFYPPGTLELALRIYKDNPRVTARVTAIATLALLKESGKIHFYDDRMILALSNEVNAADIN